VIIFIRGLIFPDEARHSSSAQEGHAKRRRQDHILTSHAGSLPRPDDLIDANRAANRARPPTSRRFQEPAARQRRRGRASPEGRGDRRSRDGDVRQVDGARRELSRVWATRSSASEARSSVRAGSTTCPRNDRDPAKWCSRSFADRRDRLKFAAASDLTRASRRGRGPALWRCASQAHLPGHEAIRSTSAPSRRRWQAAGVEEGLHDFHRAGQRRSDRQSHYRRTRSLFACADAMREEYRHRRRRADITNRTIRRSAENWDMSIHEPAPADYRTFSMVRVEALNHALKACRRIGSGSISAGELARPHTTDIRCARSRGHAGGEVPRLFVEAGNVRHEHEWKVWPDVSCRGKLHSPGS